MWAWLEKKNKKKHRRYARRNSAICREGNLAIYFSMGEIRQITEYHIEIVKKNSQLGSFEDKNVKNLSFARKSLSNSINNTQVACIPDKNIEIWSLARKAFAHHDWTWSDWTIWLWLTRWFIQNSYLRLQTLYSRLNPLTELGIQSTTTGFHNLDDFVSRYEWWSSGLGIIQVTAFKQKEQKQKLEVWN